MHQELMEIKEAMDTSILKRMYPNFFERYEFGGYYFVGKALCYTWIPKKVSH